MTSPILIAIIASSASTYPDVLDLLRAPGAKPRVNLLLDASGSMGFGATPTPCPWFVNNLNGGNTNLTPSLQMKAALVGCNSADDGILDSWSLQADLAITKFGSTTDELAPFGSTNAELEAAVLTLPANEWTRITDALLTGARNVDAHFNGANSSSCDTFFQVLVTDGTPAGGGDRIYDKSCSPSVLPTNVTAARPQDGARYLNTEGGDMICRVDSEQVVRSHTVGLGAPGAYSPRFLQDIARGGGGRYYHARRTEEMSRALDSILLSVNSRANVFSGVAIERDGFFTGNYAYYSAYGPSLSGAWNGNLYRVCLLPDRLRNGDYDTSDVRCLFRAADGETLVSNPDVADLWGGGLLADDLSGGHNAVLRTTLGGVPAPPFYDKRTIKTWTAGAGALVSVDPAQIGRDLALSQGCALHALIAQLHGYADDMDCDLLAPRRLDPTPMADTVHGTPVHLRYGECEGPGGSRPNTCYVAVATNEGMLKFVDTADGAERSALVPGDLWSNRVVNRSLLSELVDQPSSEFSHRYLLDGALVLDHVDINGNLAIDGTEKAHLWFSSGRAGRARYVMDVSDLGSGVLADTTPIKSFSPVQGGVFSALRESWSKPWLGALPFGGADVEVVAFGSGHVSDLDLPTPPAAPSPPPAGAPGQRRTVACSGAGSLSEQNGYPGTTLCTGFNTPLCSGNLQRPCYDGALVPLDHYSFPLGLSDGVHQQAAIRFQFSTFDLGPSDVLRVEDGQGNLTAEYRARDLENGWTDWVYGETAILRLVTDGVDSVAEGFVLVGAEWELGRALADLRPSDKPRANLEDHRPMVYIADAARLSTQLGRGPIGTSFDESVLRLVITRDCPPGLGAPCLDQTTASDLEHFVCPVSAELSSYRDGDQVKALYFADECGQIFKYYEDTTGAWTVRRLLNLNGGNVGMGPEYRKFFTRLEVVETACAGSVKAGIYFGTGDQPLASTGARPDASPLNDGRDLIGVVIDSAEAAGNWTQAHLEDRSTVDADPEDLVEPGWRIHLRPGEKLLRDPWVLGGQSFYQTFEPSSDITACRSNSGTERIYVTNSCTGAPPPGSTPGSRVSSQVDTDLGLGLTLLAPKDEEPFLTAGRPNTSHAPKEGDPPKRGVRLYLWRLMQ